MSTERIEIYCDYDKRDSFYMHYKGTIYILIGHAIHTETREQLVLYKDYKSDKTFARPKKMFFGKTEDGQERFKKLKPIKYTSCPTIFEL